MKTFLGLFAFFFITNASAETRVFSSWDEACSVAAESVAEGDIIFVDIDNYIFKHVAEATLSWTAHVGTVFKNKDGEWIVSQSTIPLSRDSELCDFLKHSSDFRFQIKRLKRPLTSTEIATMRKVALANMKVPYDLSFNFDSNKKLFCSKMVYMLYDAIGVKVGKIQKFREILAENPTGSQTFWKYYFHGRIPWDQKTLTPASQNRDPQFALVLDAY